MGRVRRGGGVRGTVRLSHRPRLRSSTGLGTAAGLDTGLRLCTGSGSGAGLGWQNVKRWSQSTSLGRTASGVGLDWRGGIGTKASAVA